MTVDFRDAFSKVVMIEGGYSDHPSDRGGKTMYGITERVARAHGYDGEMRDMPLEVAEAIYKGQYWDTLRLDEVAQLSYAIAEELFDTAVNCGVGVAGRFLQRALNAFNRQGQDYPDLEADGVIGPVSIDALKSFCYRRDLNGERVMLRALNCLQGVRYLEIAERDHSQEDFTFGWFRARVGIPA